MIIHTNTCLYVISGYDTFKLDENSFSICEICYINETEIFSKLTLN